MRLGILLPAVIATAVWTLGVPLTAQAEETLAWPDTAPADQALIRVFRQKKITGAANRSHVFVNGAYLALIKNGRYASVAVDPGEVQFSTLRRIAPVLIGASFLSSLEREKNERLTINVEANQTYYVEWLVGDRMKLADQAKYDKLMKKMRPADAPEPASE